VKPVPTLPAELGKLVIHECPDCDGHGRLERYSDVDLTESRVCDCCSLERDPDGGYLVSTTCDVPGYVPALCVECGDKCVHGRAWEIDAADGGSDYLCGDAECMAAHQKQRKAGAA
jgi:hypothetical protein